jgi:hypothetical protein
MCEEVTTKQYLRKGKCPPNKCFEFKLISFSLKHPLSVDIILGIKLCLEHCIYGVLENITELQMELLSNSLTKYRL